MWRTLLGLAVAGALGTLARYGVSSWVQHHAGGRFPWGTLAVNLLGCFLFGLIWALTIEGRWQFGANTRIIILAGFLGAFTTFSTFAFETSQAIQGWQWLPALGNMALQNVLGIGLALAGIALGNWILMPR